MGGLECAQFSKSSSEDIGVGLFKDNLGFSGDYIQINKKKFRQLVQVDVVR